MTDGYANVNNFIIILADDRDPDVSWRNHLARGSAGGVDVVAPVGTPLFAPADCVIANSAWNGTAGHTVTMSFADGWRDQFMHLSKFVEPGPKKKGQLVGYSGRTASGQVNGVDPHVHWHRIDPSGYRRNPWHYFTGSGLAGGGYTPIEEFLMALSDAEQAELLKNIRDVRNAIFYGGNSMPDGKRSIAQSLADIASGRRPVVVRDLDGNGSGETLSALQDNADTNTFVRSLLGRPSAVLSAEDRQAIASLVAGEVVRSLPEGADAEVIAEAVRAKFRAEPLS